MNIIYNTVICTGMDDDGCIIDCLTDCDDCGV